MGKKSAPVHFQNYLSLLNLPCSSNTYCIQHFFNAIITELSAKEFTNLARDSLVMKGTAINTSTAIQKKQGEESY